MSINIAVLIPCLNEAKTIASVVHSFSKELPSANIYVFDNNSSDKSVSEATGAGAHVRHVRERGKGNVVREMFRQINADVYVMVDGDMTYPPSAIHQLMEPILNNEAHMVVGDRISSSSYSQQNTRAFHTFGNDLVVFLINKLFSSNCRDILSGYRVFSKPFAESFPLIATGFEVETELTLHCLDKRIAFTEIPIDYYERPAGSTSKLNTFSDGWRIIRTIANLFKDYKPLAFFSIFAAFFFIICIVTGGVVVHEFFSTAYITHVPLAIFATATGLVSLLLFCCGLILDTVTRQHRSIFELKIAEASRKKYTI